MILSPSFPSLLLHAAPPMDAAARDEGGGGKLAIAKLGLRKCEDTFIGNNFIRGVFGRERKLASIAHEMLVDPALLILDEPTSGLDSTVTHCLVMMLGSLVKKGMTVVTLVHQP